MKLTNRLPNVAQTILSVLNRVNRGTDKIVCATFLLLALTLSAHATPPLPSVHFRDIKTYAYAWDAAAQQWQVLPRNEARIFDGHGYDGLPSNGKKQLIGKLLIDGCYAVPVVSGENVILCYRGKFKTFKGIPEGSSGIEVTKLDVTPGYKKGTLIRTAQLQRLGESAATFGDAREEISVGKVEKHDGTFHVIRVETTLAPGRYALYMPDRAFEFEVK